MISFLRSAPKSDKEKILELTHYIIRKNIKNSKKNQSTIFDIDNSGEVKKIIEEKIAKIKNKNMEEENAFSEFDEKKENLTSSQETEIRKNISKVKNERLMQENNAFTPETDAADDEITTEYIVENFDSCDFLDKCVSILEFNKEFLLLSLMLLDQVLKKMKLTEKNVYKIILMCLIETHKYHSDIPYNNKYYAKLLGLTSEELMVLELEFNKMIDYKYYVKKNDLDKYEKKAKYLWKKFII